MSQEKLELFLVHLSFWSEEEKEKYRQTFNDSSINGIRINSRMITDQEFLKLFPGVKSNEIVPNSFTYDKDEYLFGKHPYFYTGLYYLQEPSAMLPAHYLDLQGDEFVLDLCASPGGKSTQILSQLSDKGFLVSNEINFSRAQVLNENLSKLGRINNIILSETTSNLAKLYQGFFDKVILDAPCSLEGMFRKNKEALNSWSVNKVLESAKLQKELISDAYKCLKPGGELIYSTCTFSMEEDEEVVNYLLSNYHAELIYLKAYEGLNRGINQPETIRVYPFNFRGEGHYIAKIRKLDQENSVPHKQLKGNLQPSQLKEVKKFLDDSIKIKLSNQLYQINNNIYLLPDTNINISKLNVIHLGIKVGYYNNKHFIPSDNLAHFLPLNDFNKVIDLPLDDTRVSKYLKGETIETTLENGYAVIAVTGYALGWGKIVNGIVKNYFPKYLRVDL